MEVDQPAERINPQFPILLQTILGKKTLSKQELLAFCNTDFKEFFNDLNLQLHDVGFKVMMTFDKLGNQVGCLVNLESDELSRIATSYTPIEISLFRKIVDLIMNNETVLFSISRTTAQNAGLQLVPIVQPSKCEIAIKKFIADQWFDEFKGTLSFTPRLVLELDLFLKEMYPESTAQCYFCRETILYNPDRCLEDNCEVLIHTYCSAKHLKGGKCPGCQGENWKAGIIYRGNRKDQNEVLSQSQSISQRSAPSSSKSQRTSHGQGSSSKSQQLATYSKVKREAPSSSRAKRSAPSQKSTPSAKRNAKFIDDEASDSLSSDPDINLEESDGSDDDIQPSQIRPTHGNPWGRRVALESDSE